VLGVLLVGFARECAIHSVDFPVYHRTARQLIAGNFELYPTAVYDGGPMPAHEFRYAPVIAFLFVPFGFLPLELAALVFFILKVAACVYIAVVARHAGLSAAHRNLLLVALVLVGGYVVEEFRYGNAHFFCVALMVLAYDSAESGRFMTSAVALVLVIATKLTPIALLGYFVLRRRGRVCLAGGGSRCLALYGRRRRIIRMRLRGFSVCAMQKIDEEDNTRARSALVRYLTPAHGADAHHLETTVWRACRPARSRDLGTLGDGARSSVRRDPTDVTTRSAPAGVLARAHWYAPRLAAHATALLRRVTCRSSPWWP
jgi:hypothetical protein